MNELPLRDIHLPGDVSWWPLAIGWWLLPVLVVLTLFIIYNFFKYKQNNKKLAYRKMALNELSNLRIEFKDENNSIELIRSISTLLRRIALSYLPRNNIASLTGEDWLHQLNNLGSETLFTDKTRFLLEQAPYMKQCEFNHNELITTCELWIKSLPKTSNLKTGTSMPL